MSTETDGIVTLLDDSQVQKIFRGLHERLNISVDFNSHAGDGLQFWDKLESDLKVALQISSIHDIENGRRKLSLVLEGLLDEQQLHLDEQALGNLLDKIVDHYFGFGIIDGLLRDDTIFGILVNGSQEVYVESRGNLQRVPLSFWSDAHLRHVIDRLCIRNNMDLPSDKNPVRTFSLPNNSSVTILVPPATPDSPCLSIRNRITKKPLTIEQLIQFGSMSAEILQFLKACIEARVNILVCGHLGSGANTLVSVLSSFIPGDERVISIEYETEFVLRVNHLIRLMASKDSMNENAHGKLLVLAGNMRGDRIILGECLPSDTYTALNSINDDFSGSLLRVVAKSPADAVNRLETYIQLEKTAMSPAKIRNLISSSINLIVYQERLRDGSRAVKNIVEVLDKTDSNGQVALRELFGIEQTGVKDGRIIRKFVPLGSPSGRLLDRIKDAGIELPSDLFASVDSAGKTRQYSETERRAIKFSKGKYAFVSYSREDEDRVRILAKELENKGFDVWLDVLDIKPGEEWGKALEIAIKNAGAFLVVLTPSAANSPFVRNEITMAQDERLPVIPVKMDACDIPLQIRALQYIQYDKHNESATIDQISESLSKFISNTRLLGDI